MPLDPSDKAELMTLLREGIDALAVKLGQGRRVAAADAERIWPAAGADDEHIWLTTKEAAAFLRMALSSFFAFKKEHPTALVTSHPPGPGTVPLYQLASLRRLMLENAVGLPEPLPGMADIASKPNGKRRGVILGAVNHR